MESKGGQSFNLCYGQIVRLHGNIKDQQKGLLIAKGFTDNNVYYMNYEQFESINNYRESLFQILPRGAFDIHDEYLKSQPAQREILGPRIKTEANQYHIIKLHRFNEEIIFGAEVMFKHIDSDQYLMGSYQCSEFSPDAFKLQLTDLLSSQNIFKLQPYQTFQKEGHPIYIDEPLIVLHMKSKCKLDFIQDKRVFIDQKIDFALDDEMAQGELQFDPHAYEVFRPVIRKPNDQNARLEAVVNYNCNTNWVLKLHETYDESKERQYKISSYDLVFFQYTKNKSLLSANPQNANIILKEPKNKAQPEYYLDSIWEVQPIDFHSENHNREIPVMRARGQTIQDNLSRFGGGRNSIQIGYFSGGEKGKQQQKKYILRHYQTGKVITVSDVRVEGRVETCGIINDFEVGAEDQYMEIQMAKKGFEELVQNVYVRIMHGGKELQIREKEERRGNKARLRRNSSFSNQGMLFKSLNEEDLDYVKQPLELSGRETLHAFQIVKVSEEQKKDLLFVVSCQEMLQQFSDILKLDAKDVEAMLNDKVLAAVQDVLKALLAYLMGVEDKSNIEHSESLPVRERQIFMKDLSMIELIMEIIYFISNKNEIESLFRRWKSEREKLKAIYKLSYRLIEKMTRNNPQIKLHVSQWLELFLDQAMKIDDSAVLKSLSELLDDNYQAITKFITKTTLKRLVNILKKQVPHAKYLNILSWICVCKGKSIINNQIHTLALFYQEPSIEFRFQFKHENNLVWVSSHIGKKDLKWRTLRDFYDDSDIADQQQSWRYFLSYFNLLGDVCMNRNKFAKQYVEDNFTLSILCSIIEDKDCLETNAMECFLRLIHFAYIDCQHYTPIRRIARVREWDTIETKNDILRTHAATHLKPENCDLKRVMLFIQNFLENFTFFQVDSKKKDYNSVLFTVLQVLKCTLTLGFWKSVTNLQSILPNLIKICSCHRDFQNYKDEEQQNTLDYDISNHYKHAKQKMTRMNMENLLIMKCKMLSCEIIDIMIDMETNVRVSKSTQILKKMINEQEEKQKQAEEKQEKEEEKGEKEEAKKASSVLKSTFFKKKKEEEGGQKEEKKEEKKEERKEKSILRKIIESQNVPETSGTPNYSQLKQMNIFKNMANVFKKNQEQSQQLDQTLYDVRVWLQNFEELISERSLFVKVPTDKYNLEVLFAEMSLFESPQMLEFGLRILKRIYGQRKELLLNFEKIVIVFQGFTYDLSKTSRVTRTKLLALNDRNILSVNFENQKDFNAFIWRESQKHLDTGIIQDMQFLCQTLKRGGEVRREEVVAVCEDYYPENGLFAVYTEKEFNHRLHQSLLKWQDLHLSIFPFLEIGLEVTKDKDLLMKCIHCCYNYLTMLVWNNIENKMDFLKNFRIPSLYQHCQFNVGCIDFLKELFTNNKLLLFSEKHIHTVCTSVIGYCNQIDITQYYKAKLIDFLRVLLQYNGKSIKNNQIIVMSKLQEKQNNNIMFLLKHDTHHQFDSPQQRGSTGKSSLSQSGNLYNPQAYSQWMDDYQQHYTDSFETKYLNISPEVTYMFSFFEVFTSLIEDGNEINMGKCRNMHPYHQLLELLNSNQNCWPLKRYLRAYMNRLYYLGDDYDEMSQLIIESDFENIIQDLQDIIDLKIQHDQLELHQIKLKHPVRYSYLESYVYLTLEENLISLNTFFNNQKFLEDLEDSLTQNYKQQKFKLHMQLIQLTSQLQQIKRIWSYSKHITQFSQILIKGFCEIFMVFDLSILLIRECLYMSSMSMHQVTEDISVSIATTDNPDGVILQSSTSQSDPAKQLSQALTGLSPANQAPEYINMNINEFKQKVIKQILVDADNHLSQLQKNAISKQEKVQKHLKKMFNLKNEENKEDINEALNKKHRKLMSTLNEDERCQRFFEEEFIQVCEKMNQIDVESERIYGASFPVITLKEFITNIIYLNINHPKELEDELRIFFLKVLARFVTSKNTETTTSIDYWTPEEWSNSKSQIEEAQLFLEECGGAELICHLLKEPNLELRITLTNELLIFGIAFLLGGNTKCQNSILVRMQDDKDNVMLTNYTIMIKKIGRVIYNNFKIRKQKREQQSVFQVQLIDNYDFYDEKMDMMQRYHHAEPDDDKENLFKKNCLDIMCRSFRVLQLLCENNNVEMKNFIRQQQDHDKTVRLNSINFIEFTTSQLRIFFKIINNKITNIPNFMLDFLIEITQLPCLENQLTLCKTTFFEDSCYLCQFLSSKTNQLARLYEKPEDIVNLQEIYNKIIIAVMSVLEGNDERIYEEIQNKLETRFLIEIIRQNMDALQVVNGKDMKRLLELNEEMFSEVIVKILNVLVIKQKINLKVGSQTAWVQDLDQKLASDKNMFDIIRILETKVRKIEIVYQEKPQMVFFPSHPLFEFISDQTKDKIMFHINRETQREKILGLLEQQQVIFNEIEYNHKLNQLEIPVTHRTIQHLRNAAATISIILNLLMMQFYSVEIENSVATYHAEFYEKIILAMLALLQFVISTVLFIVYLLNFGPLCLKMKAKEEKEEQEEEEGEEESWEWVWRKRRELEWKRLAGASGKVLLRVWKKVLRQVENAYFLLMNEENFVQFFLFWVNSFLGTFFKNYFFSLHLFDIFSRLSLLRNVFQAISYNAKQLCVTAMLGVLFVFAFSFIAFDTYVDDIYSDENHDESCSSIIQCMITLTTSGVVGESMSQWDPVKFMLDMVYFVFFGLLFTNIVSGIMIDTFAELRDQRQKIEDDKKNKCFICGIDRQTLEKEMESFEHHIDSRHYLWNYLFYIYCLIKKDSTEYSGLEYAIMDMINKEDISWFPITSAENNSIMENFEGVNRKIEQIKVEMEENTVEILTSVKNMLAEKNQEEKDKKK